MSFILVVACSFLVYLAEKSDDQETEKEDGELNDLGEGLYFGMVIKFVFFHYFSACTHICYFAGSFLCFQFTYVNKRKWLFFIDK